MQNVSHTVNELSFGKPLAKYKKRRLSSAPEEYRTTKTLDGQTFVTEELHSSHHHNLDVIHARYVKKKTYFFGLVDLSDDINFYQYLTQVSNQSAKVDHFSHSLRLLSNFRVDF